MALLTGYSLTISQCSDLSFVQYNSVNTKLISI